MKIKKSELNSLLVTIASQRTEGEKVTMQGLVNENISLGLKRRLQKIFKEAMNFLNELNEDVKEIPEGNTEALDELMNEEVEINQDMVSLEMIEKIETVNNYDWDLIEKIAK